MHVSRRQFSLAMLAAAAGLAAPTRPFAQSNTVASGQFTGKSGHASSGGVELVRKGDTVEVVLQSDFKLDNGPDPKVAFGNNGYVKGSIVSPLKSFSGKQSYRVPSRLDTDEFNEVYIWCERFNVPLAVAKIR